MSDLILAIGDTDLVAAYKDGTRISNNADGHLTPIDIAKAFGINCRMVRVDFDSADNTVPDNAADLKIIEEYPQ